MYLEASSGLLISMPGMSVEARGLETGTRGYCGPEERRGENRPNISAQPTFLSSYLQYLGI